jgi:7-carboxy-7-deazaguanine synthase
MPDNILISELFGPVIQGEGALAGKVSHFIRTAGCDYRCTWCDSLHAVDPKQIKAAARRLTSEQILHETLALPAAPWVTLSGGDPVAWDLNKLCSGLRFHEYKIAVETQGSLWHSWLNYANMVTCSPKPPSSGMAGRLDWDMLENYDKRLDSRLIFKIVAFDEADLDFIEPIHARFPHVPLYISTGTPQSKQWRRDLQTQVINGFRKISEAVLLRESLRDATIGCQNHVLLYGRELGR